MEDPPACVERVPDGEENRYSHQEGRLASRLFLFIFRWRLKLSRCTFEESTPCGFLALGRRVTRKS